MAHSDAYFRLVFVFIVIFVDFIDWHSHHVSAVTLYPNNQTRNTESLISLRQQSEHWESPAPSSFAVTQQGAPSAPFADPNVSAVLQQQQRNKQQQQQQQQQRQQVQQAYGNVADSIASNVLHFGLSVGNELSQNTYYSKSEVFSPLSIMSALALLFVGAKGNSYQQLKPIFSYNTIVELQRDPNYWVLLHEEFGSLLRDVEVQDVNALKYRRKNAEWRDTPVSNNIRGTSQKQRDPSGHIIKVSNGLFAQNGYNLNPNYRTVIDGTYRSELAQLDFRNYAEVARQYINTWVSKNTFGKIPAIINNAIPQSTNIILASTLYFKGFWENTFFEGATTPDIFFPEGENQPGVQVQMMATGGVFPFYDAPEYDCRILGLPYKGNLTTMYIIQPNKSSRAKLKDFQSKLTPEMIDYMIGKMAHRTAVLAFPKMHMVRQLNMKEMLQHFGVLDIFSNSASDLSLIGGISTVVNTYPVASPILRAPTRPLHSEMSSLHSTNGIWDRYQEEPLFFSNRFGDIVANITKPTKATAVEDKTKEMKSESTGSRMDETTEAEVENTTITIDADATNSKQVLSMDGEMRKRQKRQIPSTANSSPLSVLENERLLNTAIKSDLFVEDIVHKVDFEVNEQGTEAAAATLTYLRRSGTEVLFRAETPFLFLIRHDPTKLILFYGMVNEPET